MKSVISKISESELRQDSQGRYYKTITFEKINDDSLDHPILGLISIVGRVKRRKLRCYKSSIINYENADLGFHEPIGTHFFGDIVSKEVEPYDIVDNDVVTRVNKYSVIVFGNSESELFKMQINEAFESSGHKLINKEDQSFTIAK